MVPRVWLYMETFKFFALTQCGLILQPATKDRWSKIWQWSTPLQWESCQRHKAHVWSIPFWIGSYSCINSCITTCQFGKITQAGAYLWASLYKTYIFNRCQAGCIIDRRRTLLSVYLSPIFPLLFCLAHLQMSLAATHLSDGSWYEEERWVRKRNVWQLQPTLHM